MMFQIDSTVATRYPEVGVAVIDGEVARIRPEAVDTLSDLRREAEDRLRSLLSTPEDLTNHPHIAAWRATYQSFGVNPKKDPPTHEALARRLLKGKGWPRIHLLVDIYLTNQVAHLLPHGGYDLATIEGDIFLTTSPGGEPFLALGGGQEVTTTGEVIYRDARRVLTRCWNCQDCDVTKLTPDTKRFVLMIESPSRLIRPEILEHAGHDLIRRYSRCFEGQIRLQMVNANSTAQIGHSVEAGPPQLRFD